MVNYPLFLDSVSYITKSSTIYEEFKAKETSLCVEVYFHSEIKARELIAETYNFNNMQIPRFVSNFSIILSIF